MTKDNKEQEQEVQIALINQKLDTLIEHFSKLENKLNLQDSKFEELVLVKIDIQTLKADVKDLKKGYKNLDEYILALKTKNGMINAIITFFGVSTLTGVIYLVNLLSQYK
jgi:hypothetical protein